MSRLLSLLFILPLFLTAQTKDFPVMEGLGKIYTQAIGDFIKVANKKNKSNFDTLFFGKRKFRQADDFPDIELPKKIENTQIRLVPQELIDKIQKEHPSHIFINLVAWVNKDNAEFIFVVFSNGFAHQYDYHFNYKYDTKKKEFVLEKTEFIGPPFK